MQVIKTVKNWRLDSSPNVLKGIHNEHVNIAIYQRDISTLTSEINGLIEQKIDFRSRGNVETIEQEIQCAIGQSTEGLIIQDIKSLLHYFQKVANTNRFRLLLATINTNMCRKFHTDINDLRMLCTYSGPGTLWLTDDNVNRQALNVNSSDNRSIVLDKDRIQQTEKGAVVLLKGALYPKNDTKAIVHRSPTIEETGEKRLLLRIDTNASLNLWK